MEVGGRWSEESWTFLRLLAQAKAETVTPALRRSAEYTFLRRWAAMLAVAAQSAFAATLVGEPSAKMQAWNDTMPDLGEVLHDREVPAEGPSRLRWKSGLEDGALTDLLWLLLSEKQKKK